MPHDALKVRAALLYERSLALSSGSYFFWRGVSLFTRFSGPQTPNDPNYWHEIVGVGNAVRALYNRLPPVQGYVSSQSAVDLDALFTNTLVLVCTIHIQKNSDPAEAFRAAQQAVSLIRHLNDTDYEYVDPLFAVIVPIFRMTLCCLHPRQVWWNFVANTYIASIRGSGTTRQPFIKAEDDLRLVLHALNSLGKYVPLAGG